MNSFSLGPHDKLYDLLDEQVINESQNQYEEGDYFPFN